MRATKLSSIAVPWLSMLLSAHAQTSSPYLDGLQTTLSNLGLAKLSNALQKAREDAAGVSLLATLSSGQEFTLYTPVDEAWNVQTDLVKILSYHISPSKINTTEVAPPGRHTIAYTELRQDQTLPGNQSQVIVLESAPEDASRALIRGADWNATTRGGLSQYEKIWIQPIERLIDTLRLPLDSSAPNGTTTAIELLQSLGLQDTFSACKGCTFFIPNDGALALVNVSALNGAQKANVLLNHVINGDVRYSTEFNAGDTWTSAAGQTVVYGVNATGAFITSGGAIAKIVRSDILTNNGIIHLVNRVIGGPLGNPDRASSALSAASAQAATQTDVPGVIGRITSSAPATQTQTARPSTSSSSACHRRIARGFWSMLVDVTRG